jgi:hypothetical protein
LYYILIKGKCYKKGDPNMAKEEMIKQILEKFTQMGVPYQTGMGTDIAISTDFLDAKWGSGKKKISYEASIVAEESSGTFFMWEMTKETASGFSFGSSSESSFQSGTTLFRKVKSIQYGPEGKAYEYTLDLGAIPKAVKETADSHGWKFKTVLNKKKALWPEGYSTPLATSQTKGKGQAESRPQATQGELSFCAKCGNSLTPEDLFCPNCGTKKQTEGKPQDGLQQQTHVFPQQEYDHQPKDPIKEKVYQDQRPFYTNSNLPKERRPGVLFWTLFSLSFVFDILLFMGGSGPLFIVLAALVLIGLFIIRNSLSRSIIKLIGAFVGAAIITFVIFAFTVGGGGKLTPEQAQKIVNDYAEVKNVKKNNPKSPVYVELMENKADQYIFRAYTIVASGEDLSSHTATFGWYAVNKMTGETKPVNP